MIKFFEGNRGQIIIAQVDPDALGAAFGVKHYLARRGTESDVFFAGRSGHPQNEAIMNKFDLLGKMRPVAELVSDRPCVLVDSCRGKDSRLPFPIKPVAVIDHHRDTDLNLEEVGFVIIDDRVGSASTLVAEMLEEPDLLDPMVCTLLALGIYTDTKSMLRASERDHLAYAKVKDGATSLGELINYTRPFAALGTLARAVRYVEENKTFKEGRMVASLGRLPTKRGDDLAFVADEFLRTTSCVLAVTWAVIEDKVRVCARSNDLTLNLGTFLRERFGGNCGAKMLPDGAGEGGALVQLEGGSAWLTEDELIEAVDRRIREWIFS